MNLNTHEKYVIALIGEASYEAILDEVEFGRIDKQKMDDIACLLSPKIFGSHSQRGGCSGDASDPEPLV